MKETIECTHPESGIKRVCDQHPIGLVAYIDKRMLKGTQDPSGEMAGRLAYISGRDIGEFSGKMLVVPRVDIACTRNVIQTMYPLTVKNDVFTVMNEATGKNETSIIDKDSNNIQFLTAPFPSTSKRDVINWMKEFQPKLKEKITSQIIEWEEIFHACLYVRGEMYQLLEVMNGERFKSLLDGFENQYQVLLSHLENGTELEQPLNELPDTNRQKTLPEKTT